MASRKPAIINGTFKEVDSNAKIADVVSPNVVSITTPNGVVHRQDFNRCPVPDQYNTNLTPMDKGYDKRRLLVAECEQIQRFLNEFTPPVNGESRKVSIEANGELIVIENFPLPDGMNPDYVSLILDIKNYPEVPPLGFYVLQTNANTRVLNEMDRVLGGHVFDGSPLSRIAEIPGYSWICLHARDYQWQFNLSDPFEGDCLWKSIETMFQMLEADSLGRN